MTVCPNLHVIWGYRWGHAELGLFLKNQHQVHRDLLPGFHKV